jgi:Ferritin-like
MSGEPTIDTREGLIAALHEAAEIEHGLLLQYLFAALSLRQTPDESLTPEQFTMVRRWKGTLLGVAVDEMGHLGTVFNLLAAIGAPPHLNRPAFPRATGYYPFAFELIAFSDEALRRFVTAELPRGFTVDDCLGGAPALAMSAALVPEVPSYRYVGELYAKIADGFRAIPEATLFIGSRTRQVDNRWSANVDMRIVEDRASALDAIEDIVADGEGAPDHREDSHYGQFCQMWRAFREQPFAAARPVVTNPRTRPPRDATGVRVVLIEHEVTLRVAEVFNLAYAVMLRLLAQFFANDRESPEQRDEIRSACARMMSVAIRPIAEVLTALPVSTRAGAGNAGPTFELYLPIEIAPEPRNRWVTLFESFDAVIGALTALAEHRRTLPAVARLAGVADTLRIMERTLRGAAGGTR